MKNKSKTILKSEDKLKTILKSKSKSKSIKLLYTKGYNEIDTNFVDYTSIHGTQVDFIFSKKPYSFIKTINFSFSDHLPIFAIFE
jgi:hypothetical protein